MILAQLELAELFGADRNTIASWTRAGMPVTRRGRGSVGHEYDAGVCVRWLRERDRAQHAQALAAAKAASGLQPAKARKWAAEAARAEFEQAKREQQFVPVAEVAQRWAGIVLHARTALLGLPMRARQRLPHLSASDAVVLDGMVREALEGLAERGSSQRPDEGTPRGVLLTTLNRGEHQ
jgi:phage terminase Nu1 subunit (DNA packaging protein)